MTKLQKTSNFQPPIPRAARLVLGVWSFIGAWTLGSWSFAAAPAAPSATPAPEPPALSRIVSRLSTAASRSGRDWAEFARETVTWGSRLKSTGDQVPEGPVRDALAAVDLGSQLDPKTADWPKLREELEALLQKPEEPPPQDQQKQEDQQNQQQQNQDQQKQDQQQKQNSSDQQQKQDQPQQQKDSEQKQEPQDSEKQPQNQKQPQDREDQSAFGDMEEKNIPPPPEETQQVGGVPERKEGTPPPADPNLALPLQKLEQLKNQDSPAELFQLMEDRKDDSSRKTKKDW